LAFVIPSDYRSYKFNNTLSCHGETSEQLQRPEIMDVQDAF
jgi:hypothetical protein